VLRADLTATLATAQQQLEAAISSLRRSASPELSRSEMQLSDLIALQRGVATATPSALARLSSQIAAVAAEATTSAQNAMSASGSSTQTTAGMLAQARDDARHTVDAVMAGMKDFDPYLKFASPEDERAYRERENARQAEIERQQAKSTPQGELNALQIAKQQMDDAGSHGANRSPDFADRRAALDDAQIGLSQAVQSDRAEKPMPKHESDLAAAMKALSSAGVRNSAANDQDISHGLNVDTSAGYARLR